MTEPVETNNENNNNLATEWMTDWTEQFQNFELEDEVHEKVYEKINSKDFDNLLVYGYLRRECYEFIDISIPKEIFYEIFRFYPKLIHLIKFPKTEYNISIEYDKYLITGCQVNLLQNGQRLMNDGNLKEAIISFEAYVQHCKNNYKLSKAWQYLGIAQSENENTESAILCFKESYKYNPYNLDVLLPLSVAFCNESDTNNALNAMKQWIANHIDYMELIDDQEIEENEENEENKPWSLSTNLVGQSDLDLYQKAFKKNNTDHNLNFIMGILYNLTSEYDKAEEHFKIALKSKPNDANLWNKLGATQANGGKPEDAINSYKKALAIKPNYVRVLSNAGIAMASLENHKEACVYYLKCLTLNNDAKAVWNYLNMSLMHLNRTDLSELVKKKDTKYFRNDFDF